MSTAAAAPARTGAVLADLLPAARHRYAVDTALVLGGAALTGIAAQIAVPVPGSPVPVTGQTFAALLVGTALGARRGFLSLAVYALVGMAGMPWFSEGTSGMGFPSFGYVLGMLLAASVVGGLARRGGDRSVLRTAGTMVLGSAIIYAVGVPYLALATGMSASAAIAAGLVPFLLGDALKAALAMGALPAAWKLIGRRG
ncbi:biotin transporter BioY [Streptomyces sp. NBC_00257]|uniref:biotin transporter BioY n=1 Tax=Streptomyces TaxID=1883 RepID=UPI000F5C02E1|nr:MULTISPECIES: biotin transporter BioY [unclassified Streptomyces]WSW07863.1 biotin transporter BioY [Streptomyces sp. NBC_01005]WSX01448.1 biotin transporter BioY [Streptomyces sp. NBC_00987]WTB54322.1 biotin transporter BioY [Streptomyces sp. NBC_00826]WTC97373.1 biotin transporter BioY [Streptomyces sp. NBC_01650]WTH92789.1 biotin transporter BioY [Streptomyces sp. NBC_00825]WTI01520.1 biotin transporter BioY [Streptomyces sp. NBC_00822]